jgi:stress response protein YsnF
MAFETLVAAFDTKEHATAAVAALKAGGFHSDDISIFDHSRLKVGKEVIGTAPRQAGVWQWLFGTDLNLYEANVYGSTIDDGGTVVSVRVPPDQVAQASGILDLHHPIDIHDRAVTANIAPAAQVESAAKSIAAMPLAKEQTVAVTPKMAEIHGDTLRLAEEQLQIGKKMVEAGRTRVRRFTTERDVAQDVTLHEEHAELLRKAISQPAELTDVDWADSALEVIETKEHALVSKTARVVEEISLRKKGDDHVETIHEKLRRQQAEVEQVDAAGNPIRRA